jgi:inosine/xanthosine triphosphate pyrophosphatase family protein
MKTVIFATSNPTKARRFSEGLNKHDIEILSLKDIDMTMDIEENGKNAIENALIKARACFKLTKKPSMGMDDNLFLEGVPDEKQPGMFVRRVNGKALNDDEMITHYTELVKQYGKDGKLPCKWIYGLAVIDEHGKEHTYTWEKGGFYMVSVPSDIVNPGYPLNSISKYNFNNKYFTETSKEELASQVINEDHVVEFIAKFV